jgi:hypothetical protein
VRFDFKNRGRGPNGGELPLIAKLVQSVFFAVFAVMGGAFLVMFGKELIAGRMPLFAAFFLLVPLAFLAVGLGSIYFIWFRKKKELPKTPQSKTAGKISPKRFLFVFGLVFMAVGLVASYFLLVRPLAKIHDARGWVETPCTIKSAEVKSHSSDDGTTYSIEIVYGYNFEGIRHEADQYDFIGGSSSGRRGKQEVVNRYRKAANPVCYVNPEDPAEAVLQRDLTWKNALGLFPLPFLAVGIGVLIYAWKYKGKKGSDWLPKSAASDRDSSGDSFGFARTSHGSESDSITLKSSQSPLVKLAVTVAFCLFWNGIVSFFVYQVIEGFRHGHPEWFLTIFMIPFVLVGLGSVSAVFYMLLACFNPRYALVLRPGSVYPGTSGTVAWGASGSSGRVRQLSIKLIGQEKATYTVGTNTRTDESTFFEAELVNTTNMVDVAEGQATFTIPADTMHSFEADNNKIVWCFKLEGDISLWPNVTEEYQLVVRPQEPSNEDGGRCQ